VRVLVVEDEVRMAALLKRGLEEERFAVDVAATAEDGVWLATENPYDAILLDVMLPDGDGFGVCRRIREGGQWAPVLMLTARDAVPDRVRGLDAGADDYLTKPFAMEELLARMRAVLRRKGSAESQPSVIRTGDLEIDLGRRLVTRAGSAVHLTPTEFALLEQLVTNPGKLLTHRHLLTRVWGDGYGEESHYLRVYVAGLRKKLEPDPGSPSLIVTEPGVGYRWNA
jgi:two-component system, OmpR family, response regulator